MKTATCAKIHNKWLKKMKLWCFICIYCSSYLNVHQCSLTVEIQVVLSLFKGPIFSLFLCFILSLNVHKKIFLWLKYQKASLNSFTSMSQASLWSSTRNGLFCILFNALSSDWFSEYTACHNYVFYLRMPLD